MRDRLLTIIRRLQSRRDLPRALLQTDNSLKDPAEDIADAFLADPLIAAALDLLAASKEGLERLEASQPASGTATAKVCRRLRNVIALAETKNTERTAT